MSRDYEYLIPPYTKLGTLVLIFLPHAFWYRYGAHNRGTVSCPNNDSNFKINGLQGCLKYTLHVIKNCHNINMVYNILMAQFNYIKYYFYCDGIYKEIKY